jgi:hypothetical protein
MRNVTGFKRQISREGEIATLITLQGVQRLWFLGSYQRERKTGVRCTGVYH